MRTVQTSNYADACSGPDPDGRFESVPTLFAVFEGLTMMELGAAYSVFTLDAVMTGDPDLLEIREVAVEAVSQILAGKGPDEIVAFLSGINDDMDNAVEGYLLGILRSVSPRGQ